MLTLKGTAEEQDKIPESGTSTSSIKVSSIKKTLSKTLKITVKENRGKWEFVYKIEKQ